ncbi:glucosamine-phosphate N-acetyltransferase [Nematocida sp. AWRm78]|nr:glucosamine-phosphate N-acetyltransferase [Nematocida sp. AWRm79]KAI5185178.1 glucosamine-phosphate N-acetyltransferase [Nematocida sp. AWRm78]
MSFTIRKLKREDLTEEYFSLLSVLTEAPFPGKEQVDKMYEYMQAHEETYNVFVVCSPEGKLVGSGTLLIEKKFIRSLGSVGHIEDIVISNECQGKGLGRKLITFLSEKAKTSNCYKVILACSEENQKFYEKCGFVKKEVMMALYNS